MTSKLEIAVARRPAKALQNGHEKKQKIQGIRDGWFSETEPMYPGQKFSLALEEFSQEKSVLYYNQSEYQSILVFRSAQYGNVLVLDGVIQLTERDEYCYHEMMTHVPIFSHVNPRNVLIVGGGDGALLREVCKHREVTSVTLCEIDKEVIQVAKQFFPDTVGTAFEDERVTIIHEDGAKFLLESNETQQYGYDVIIADTLDPVGPAETLFQPRFYQSMYEALNEGGIVCAQSECMWIHLPLIVELVGCCTEMFNGGAEYASILTPTYPCGQVGFILASKRGPETSLSSCRVPKRLPSEEFMSQMKYYNPQVHSAAFVLPEFVKRELEPFTTMQPSIDYDDDYPDQGDECFLQGCVVS